MRLTLPNDVRAGASGLVLRGLLLCGLLIAGCGDEPVPTGVEPDPDPGPDIDALFSPATPDEIAAVRADWESRDVAPVDPRVEASELAVLGGDLATLRVVSHEIEGGRHYGAVITPVTLDRRPEMAE